MNYMESDKIVKQPLKMHAGADEKEKRDDLDEKFTMDLNNQEQNATHINVGNYYDSNEIYVTLVVNRKSFEKDDNADLGNSDSNSEFDPLAIESMLNHDDCKSIKHENDIDQIEKLHFSETFEMVEGKRVKNKYQNRTVARCKFCSKEVRRDKRQRHFKWHLMKHNGGLETAGREGLDKAFENADGKWLEGIRRKNRAISKCNICSKEVRRDNRYVHLKTHSMSIGNTISKSPEVRTKMSFEMRSKLESGSLGRKERIYNFSTLCEDWGDASKKLILTKVFDNIERKRVMAGSEMKTMSRCKLCSKDVRRDRRHRHLNMHLINHDKFGEAFRKDYLDDLFEISNGEGTNTSIVKCKFCSEEFSRKDRIQHVSWHLKPKGRDLAVSKRQQLGKLFEDIHGKGIVAGNKSQNTSRVRCKLCSKEFKPEHRFRHLRLTHSKIWQDEEWESENSCTIGESKRTTTHIAKREGGKSNKWLLEIKKEIPVGIDIPKTNSIPNCNSSAMINFNGTQKQDCNMDRKKDSKAKYSCRICQKGFSGKSGRDKHLRWVHVDVKSLPEKSKQAKLDKENAIDTDNVINGIPAKSIQFGSIDNVHEPLPAFKEHKKFIDIKVESTELAIEKNIIKEAYSSKRTQPSLHRNQCQKLLKSKQALRNHLKAHDIFQNKYQCQKNFNLKNSSKCHNSPAHGIVKTNLEDDKHLCSKCYRSFTSVPRLENHTCLICKICHARFSRQSGLKKHLRKSGNCKVSSKRDRNVCTKCQLEFKHTSSLEHHFCLYCEYCQKMFNSKQAMKYHLKTHNQNKTKHGVDSCNIRIEFKRSLRCHKRIQNTSK